MIPLGAQQVTDTLYSLGRWLPSDYYNLSSANPEWPINRPRNNRPRKINISIHLSSLTSTLRQSRSDRPTRLLRAYRSSVRWSETFPTGAQNQLAPLHSPPPDNLLTNRSLQGSHNTIGDLVPNSRQKFLYR